MDKNLKKIINLPKRLLVKEPLHLYTGIRSMFRASSTIAGLPPGQAVYTGIRKESPFRLSVFKYSEHDLEELENVPPSALPSLQKPHTFLWINVEGIHHVAQVKEICDIYGIHALTLEDILTVEQRPKIDDSEEYIYTATRMLQFDQDSRKTLSEQVSIVLLPDVLITFQERPGDTFDAVRNRLRSGKGRIRKEGSDYLFYALLDTIVDHYFIVLEKFGDELEDIEERILTAGKKRDFEVLYELKREMIHIRRSVWPLREVISRLERDDLKLIKKSTRIFIRDVYDHTIHAIDSVETYRDFISSLSDLYQSVISNKMNQVMKTLTIISVIFIPLTFIAGLYGINFENVPELKWRYGYAYFWSLIITAASITLLIFKSKKWL